MTPLGEILARPPFVFLRPFKEYLKVAATVKDIVGIEADATGRPTAASLVKSYEAWVTAVTTTVPPDQLLVHTATDGYGPLCAFLGAQPPPGDEPYPR